METKRIVVIVSILVALSKTSAVRVRPCATNKIAPYSRPEGRTFGYLFGFGGSELGSDCGTPSNPNDDPALINVDGNNQDYLDPVSSGEDIDFQSNRPFIRPQRPQRPQSLGSFGSFWNNWFPGIITEDTWPTRPPNPVPRPPPSYDSNWFWGLFGYPASSKPPPYYGNDDIKPVHEHIEGEQENVAWKPGLVVGGPNNDIVGVTQDISNWSTVPTPRPTRPFIPGQRQKGTKNRDGIIGSFVDLFTKRK